MLLLFIESMNNLTINLKLNHNGKVGWLCYEKRFKMFFNQHNVLSHIYLNYILQPYNTIL